MSKNREIKEINDEFHIKRSLCLIEYARIEMALVFLVSNLMGVDFAKASIIVLRQTSTRNKYVLINDLIEHRFPRRRKERKIWEGVKKHLEKLDTVRNNMVHWIPQLAKEKIELFPPTYWRGKKSHETIKASQLDKFLKDSEQALWMVTHFWVYYVSDFGWHNSLRKKFLQDIGYQPRQRTRKKGHRNGVKNNHGRALPANQP